MPGNAELHQLKSPLRLRLPGGSRTLQPEMLRLLPVLGNGGPTQQGKLVKVGLVLRTTQIELLRVLENIAGADSPPELQADEIGAKDHPARKVDRGLALRGVSENTRKTQKYVAGSPPKPFNQQEKRVHKCRGGLEGAGPVPRNGRKVVGENDGAQRQLQQRVHDLE